MSNNSGQLVGAIPNAVPTENLISRECTILYLLASVNLFLSTNSRTRLEYVNPTYLNLQRNIVFHNLRLSLFIDKKITRLIENKKTKNLIKLK